jgi:integrase
MSRAKREFPGARPYHDRHGVRRWRYRKGLFSAELGTDYGSDEFVRRYEDALMRQKRRADAAAHGSITWLVASYYRSPAYQNLGASTRRVYRGALEKFREAHGAKMVATLERRHVMRLMAEKAETPHAANFLRRMLHALMGHAIDLGLRTDDPTAHVANFTPGGDGFHTWDEGEIARFYETHPPGTTAHLAMTLMLFTGAARVDACRMGWGNISGGRLRYRREKTKRKTPVLIDIPLHPDLAAALAPLPRDRFTFLQTIRGASRSPNGLGNAMRRWCDAAGLPECTSHGLRKACARRLAEAGATPNMIAAVTGHTTLKEVARYTRDADRAGMADMGFDLLLKGTGGEQVLTNHPARFVKRASKSLKGDD